MGTPSSNPPPSSSASALTPTSVSPGGRLQRAKAFLQQPWVYLAFILGFAALAIVGMVVPSELITPAKDGAAINLNTTFSTLSVKGWLSLGLILIGFLLMVFDLVGADLVMNAVLALMVLFKIITVKSALAGFSNSGLWTVVILFIVAQGITSTGGADWLITKLLGSPRETMLAQVRMCVLTAVFSSFVNDTPVFCIMLPIVLTWAAKARLPIRQLLIPLSYCCLLGGLNTIIGTSTNLVVTGQFDTRILSPTSEYYQEGVSSISLFGISPYGIPVTFWGIVYIVYAAPFLLSGGPGKRVFGRMARVFKRGRGKSDEVDPSAIYDQASDFFVGLLVTPTSAAVGKTVDEAGLRTLDNIYLALIRRSGRLIHTIRKDTVVEAGDVLYFSGVPDGIEKVATTHGLVPYSDATETIHASQVPNLQEAFGTDHIDFAKPETLDTSSSSSVDGDLPSKGSVGRSSELVQATVRKGSSLVGKTIRSAAFAGRFHSAVVSIKRDGSPVAIAPENTIGDEVLKAGDQLLLDIHPQFWTSSSVNENFEEISKSGQVRSHTEFMLPMKVTKYLQGSTVLKAGLNQLPNAFLVAIDREGTTLHTISPEEILQEGDVVWFAGTASAVRFVRNTPGLKPLADKHCSKLRGIQFVERRLVQAIVARNSPLVGKTATQMHFRQLFNAAIVAVARKGERIRAHPGDIPLQAADILLLDAGPAFKQQNSDSKHFSLVIELENSNPPRYLHTAICVALVATAFILYALEILDIVVAAAVVAGTMLITGCLSAEQARRAIRWDVYLMIAGSFGVSAGLEQSGGAAAIANLIIDIGRNAGGSTFIVATVYIATTLLSQIISNNSAAALVFPIAATISKNDNIDIYILSYAVMLGASCVFMSSFGYQTNLMALAAGGHSSRDFLKFGTPMQLVLAVVSIVALAAGSDNWPYVWLVTGIVSAVLLTLPQLVEWGATISARRAKQAALA